MRDGFVAVDELWLMADSRTSRATKNRLTANILAKSRKRSLTIAFTAQVISSVDNRVRKIVDFLCLPPDEHVITNPDVKPIDKIHIGDKLLSHDGSYRTVTNTMMRKYKGDMVEVTPQNIQIPSKLTANHPVLIAKPNFKKHTKSYIWKDKEKYLIDNFFKKTCRQQAKELNVPKYAIHGQRGLIKRNIRFSFDWKEAGKLERGDLIAFPIIQETQNIETIKISDFFKPTHKWKLENGYWHFKNDNYSTNIRFPDKIKVNKEFLEIVGYYLGDGGIHKGSLSISFNNRKKNKSEEVKKLFKKVFGLDMKTQASNGQSELNLVISAKPIAHLFLQFGKGSKNKKLPQAYMRLPTEKQKALLKGYMYSDGKKVGNNGSFSYATISKMLALQISQIALRMGKKIHIQKRNPAGIGRNPIYCGYISYKNYRSYIQDGFFITPILEVKKEKYDGAVFNVSVDKTESYTTPSLCVHNCYPIMSPNEDFVKALIFRGSKANEGSFMKQIYFKTPLFFNMYSTEEEIEMEEKSKTPMRFCFQVDKDSEPEYFDTWEEADKRAEAWWTENYESLKGKI